jgi:hypothetical protein
MKKMNNRWIPFHTLLFAIFPVLSLYTHNLTEVSFSQSVRAMVYSLAGTIFLFLFFWMLSRNRLRAAIVTTLTVTAFFSFGHIYLQTRAALPEGSPLSFANIQLAIWAVGLILINWWLMRKLRNPLPLASIMTVVGVTALFSAMIPWVEYQASFLMAEPLRIKSPADLNPVPIPAVENKPDIYYIILDGYGRADVLQELYGVENQEFLSFLEERGFTIADQSYTNYGRTMHSLSSSLNFHYLDELIEADPKLNDYSLYKQLIRENAVQRFLKSQGYTTVAMATGFEITEVQGADIYLKGAMRINHFEEMLLTRSMAIFWLDQVVGNYRRDEIHQAFNDLAATTEIRSPKFVFAHLVVPHPPFVFDENGGAIEPRGWGDGTSYAGGVKDYVEKYPRQLQYVNQLVEELVVSLQENSATPPVIILQGDHGPGAVYDWIVWRNSCLRERMPILNAYFLPNQEKDSIPAGITPVNSFRLVLNKYFGTDLQLEENRMFVVENIYQPYSLVEVTDELNLCPYFPDGMQKKQSGKRD